MYVSCIVFEIVKNLKFYLPACIWRPRLDDVIGVKPSNLVWEKYRLWTITMC